jgi:hypothetical protein
MRPARALQSALDEQRVCDLFEMMCARVVEEIRGERSHRVIVDEVPDR